QTMAEKDMAIIRSKRATNAGALNAGQPKGKYRKRSRATPPGKCHSCTTRETPEWRRGPDGARTLCNACGLHYAKLMRKNERQRGPDGQPIRVDIEMLRNSTRAANEKEMAAQQQLQQQQKQLQQHHQSGPPIKKSSESPERQVEAELEEEEGSDSAESSLLLVQPKVRAQHQHQHQQPTSYPQTPRPPPPPAASDRVGGSSGGGGTPVAAHASTNTSHETNSSPAHQASWTSRDQSHSSQHSRSFSHQDQQSSYVRGSQETGNSRSSSH
ncbi:GATA-domain-containing protein, partial [Schizopora paradoxa]